MDTDYKHPQYVTECHLCKKVGLIIMTLFWKQWKDNSELPLGSVTRICKTCGDKMIEKYVDDYVKEKSRGTGIGRPKGLL